MNQRSNVNGSGSSIARWVGISILAICALTALIFLKTCNSAKKLPEIAEKFKTGKITNTFISRATEVNSTSGDILELASIRNEEIFRREDSRRALWDLIYLGTTVSEIRVPSTFRYHIRLSDSWRLAARDQVCIVLAPAIRPSIPPAIHTEEMEKSTQSGWARFDKQENLDELERGITPELEKRAADETHLRLAKEACRKSVAEFVRNWLMKEERWRQDRFTSVIVIFPDEHQIESDAELEQFMYEPTIKL